MPRTLTVALAALTALSLYAQLSLVAWAALSLAAGPRPAGVLADDRKAPPDKAPPTVAGGKGDVRRLRFTQWARVGDLRVTILEAHAESLGGQHYGNYRPFPGSMALIAVENTSEGKVHDWPGWQGRSLLSDHHGNEFKPHDMTGWSWLPHNMRNFALDGDTGDRVHPGKRYVEALYFGRFTDRSHVLTVTGEYAGVRLSFTGPANTLERLTEEGKRTERDLLAGLPAGGPPTMQAVALAWERRPAGPPEYPVGCPVRAVGRAIDAGEGWVLLRSPEGTHARCLLPAAESRDVTARLSAGERKGERLYLCYDGRLATAPAVTPGQVTFDVSGCQRLAVR